MAVGASANGSWKGGGFVGVEYLCDSKKKYVKGTIQRDGSG